MGLSWAESEDGLIIYLSKTVHARLPTGEAKELRFLARFDCRSYDDSPPPLAFCNPDNRDECGPQWWPKSSHSSENVITSNGITGNCVVGFAEYYAFHAEAARNKEDWKLSKLVRHVGNLLDASQVTGIGV